MGEFINSYTLTKLKLATRGQNLCRRIISSAMIGIGIDTILFISIAYMGVMPPSELWIFFLTHFSLKLLFEFMTLPLTIMIINKLKKSETLDIYDIYTNFTPFSLDVAYAPINNKINMPIVAKV